MKCEDVRELREAYLLGSLSAADEAAIERHLAGCADCRRWVNELADTVAALPQALAAASPLSPPESLKARLLQSIEPMPAATATSSEEAGLAEPSLILTGPSRTTGEHRPKWPFAWQSANTWQTIGRIAAVIVLAGSLVWSVRLTLALENERTLRAEYATLVEQIVGQQEIVFEVVDSDQSVRRILRATQADSTAYGKLFTRTDMAHVVAMAARLPEPPAGQTFHLWLTTGGETVLAGELTTDDQGFGLLVFDAPRDGPTYDAADLTLQPAGGNAPAGTSVLRWEAEQA